MKVEVNAEVSCHNCEGLCCRRGIVMSLSEDDVAFHERGGTDLEPIILATAEQRRQYETFSDCGYLAVGETGMGICLARDDPARPGACTEFQAGSEACIYMRCGHGLPD